ncbi:MAG TPA: HNH endonuclease [Sphingobacteriaceae bacterium]
MHNPIELTNVVNELLEYKNSNLYWKATTNRKIRKGKIAGNGKCLKIKLNNYFIYKSRVIFFLTKGYWPSYVTFKDGDKTNLNPSNLIEFKTSSRNKSGIAGVSFVKANSKWMARLVRGKKLLLQKNHNTKEEAYKSYCNALEEYNSKCA